MLEHSDNIPRLSYQRSEQFPNLRLRDHVGRINLTHKEDIIKPQDPSKARDKFQQPKVNEMIITRNLGSEESHNYKNWVI